MMVIIISSLCTSCQQSSTKLLTTDFIPITVNSNESANRGIFVVMVTSGGSSYPNGTFYTKVRGDGSGAKVGSSCIWWCNYRVWSKQRIKYICVCLGLI